MHIGFQGKVGQQGSRVSGGASRGVVVLVVVAGGGAGGGDGVGHILCRASPRAPPPAGPTVH